MSQDKVPARPRQVTMTVAMAVVFDLVLLASLFDTLGRLGSPETRAALDEVLGGPASSGLGVTTAQVVEALRVLVFVGGALAAVALVFAVFVLQRHRAARIGYTVSAALMLLTVPAVGLLPVFVALAAIPMWSRAARDWYAGRAPAPAGRDPRAVALLSQQGPPPAPVPFGGEPGPGGAPGSAGAPAAPGSAGPPAGPEGAPPPLYGQPPYAPSPYPSPYPPPYPAPDAAPSPYVQPAYGQSPQGQWPPSGLAAYPSPGYAMYAPGPRRDPDRRPVTVTIAAVLTWIGGGVTAALMLAFVGILTFGGDAFVNQFEKTAQDSNITLTANQATALGWTIAAVFLFWSVTAIVLAVLAFRRSNAARIALVVSSAMAALFSLVSITSGLSAITLLMSGAAVVLLFTGGANQWYARRSQRGGFPPAGGTWGAAPDPQHPQHPQQQAPYPPPSERIKPW